MQLSNTAAVAIAWIMQKAPYVFPIIGGRKVEHLHSNLEALSISLSPEQISAIDNIVPLNKGFPYTFFVSIPLSPYNANLTARHTGRWLRLFHPLQDRRAFPDVAEGGAHSSDHFQVSS